MKKLNILALALVALSFLTAFYFYPQMPKTMASHWGLDGQANSHASKEFALFFIPTLSLVLFIFFLILQKIDPLKKNYASFQKEYDRMVLLFTAFFYYLFLMTIAANLGYTFNFIRFLSPAFAIFIFYMGVIIEKAKQNWFIGVRTPWTLSSKTVWDSTHAKAGKMFKAAGIVALLGIIFPSWGLLASLAVLLATAIFAIVYSYVQYEREIKYGKGKEKKRK